MPQYSASSHDASSSRLTATDHHDDPSTSTNCDGSNGGGTDLNRLLNSTACNVSLGIVLLLVGIVVTSMTFKEYRATNKIFLLGPILVGAGALGIGKAVFKKYHNRTHEQTRQRRRRLRHINRFSRNSQRTDSDPVVNSDFFNRRRNDAPPPYDIVAIVTAPRSAFLPAPQNVVHVPALPNYSETDPIPPPPKYEEVMSGQMLQIQENHRDYLVEDNQELLISDNNNDDSSNEYNESDEHQGSRDNDGESLLTNQSEVGIASSHRHFSDGSPVLRSAINQNDITTATNVHSFHDVTTTTTATNVDSDQDVTATNPDSMNTQVGAQSLHNNSPVTTD